jgi:UDP-N-acetylglucosamine acyltransferase
VIDSHVSIGAGCRIGPHVYITGHTTIGPDNAFHAHSVIGDAPQDVKYKDAPTRLRIGVSNIFREGCTLHRSAKPEDDTVIGSHNFLMANSHVGHNAHVGDHVILANGALLGGHAEVEDRAFISGNCLVHQFVRVGRLAIMRGGSAVSQDLPPFVIAGDYNTICGLNIIGLRRAGLSMTDRSELKRLYQKLFFSGLNLSQAVAEARKEARSEPAQHLLEFIAASKRGVCRHRGTQFGPEAPDDPGID